MARRRASMREGPLAELFKATEAAQRQAERADGGGVPEPSERSESDAATVEHAAPDPAERTLAAAPESASSPAAPPEPAPAAGIPRPTTRV